MVIVNKQTNEQTKPWKATSVSEDVGKLEHLYIAGGKVNGGRQFGGSSKKHI